jgi:hypothetical protein
VSAQLCSQFCPPKLLDRRPERLVVKSVVHEIAAIGDREAPSLGVIN